MRRLYITLSHWALRLVHWSSGTGPTSPGQKPAHNSLGIAIFRTGGVPGSITATIRCSASPIRRLTGDMGRAGKTYGAWRSRPRRQADLRLHPGCCAPLKLGATGDPLAIAGARHEIRHLRIIKFYFLDSAHCTAALVPLTRLQTSSGLAAGLSSPSAGSPADSAGTPPYFTGHLDPWALPSSFQGLRRPARLFQDGQAC